MHILGVSKHRRLGVFRRQFNAVVSEAEARPCRASRHLYSGAPFDLARGGSARKSDSPAFGMMPVKHVPCPLAPIVPGGAGRLVGALAPLSRAF